MADLNNLLAELDDTTQDEEEVLQPEVFEEEVDRDVEGVPEVLKAAQERKYADADADNDADNDENEGLKLLDDFLDKPDEAAQDEDYARLKALWIKELLCPELLAYDHGTISLELELLEGQEETIDNLTSTNNVDALIGQIYKLDVERTKFVVSDLLGTRLQKLEDHALYNRTIVDRMSDKEVSHLKSYGELLEKHFFRTVLNHMPKEAWKKLDEPDMIETPDFNRFVFCKTIEDVEIGEQYHGKGSCLIARYEAVQKLVMEEKIELLL